MDSHLSTAPKVFTCFWRLPSEIQVMIWNAALANDLSTPRSISINVTALRKGPNLYLENIKLNIRAHIPTLLHACAISRGEALKRYRTLFDLNEKKGKPKGAIYFNPLEDTLIVGFDMTAKEFYWEINDDFRGKFNVQIEEYQLPTNVVDSNWNVASMKRYGFWRFHPENHIWIINPGKRLNELEGRPKHWKRHIDNMLARQLKGSKKKFWKDLSHSYTFFPENLAGQDDNLFLIGWDRLWNRFWLERALIEERTKLRESEEMNPPLALQKSSQ